MLKIPKSDWATLLSKREILLYKQFWSLQKNSTFQIHIRGKLSLPHPRWEHSATSKYKVLSRMYILVFLQIPYTWGLFFRPPDIFLLWFILTSANRFLVHFQITCTHWQSHLPGRFFVPVCFCYCCKSYEKGFQDVFPRTGRKRDTLSQPWGYPLLHSGT